MIQYDILYIDYQDKNCVLMNNSTVPITRHPPTTPYGGVIADLGTGNSGQPFKFGGKELISANGLNEYDFGARRYYQAVPHFTGIDPMCEKYYWLSPYLYCANNPVNLVDKDGREVNIWATTLPGAQNWIKRTGATHTFITVTDKNNKIHYYSYGSSLDGPMGAFSGRLIKTNYEQDIRIYKNKGNDPDLKSKITVPVPKGMSQDEFDTAVIETANSYGNEEGISYMLAPISNVTGNCNTSTSTILFKAGVSKDMLKEIEKEIPGIDWGFGQIKPWTKEEQQNAIQQFTNSYEILQRSMP